MRSVSSESVEGVVDTCKYQKYFDLKCGEKNNGMNPKFNILGIRNFTDGKFHVNWEFFDKIGASIERMEDHASKGAYFSPEELVGFHTWSGLTEHEKNMAVLVLKQIVMVPDSLWVEVCREGRVCYKFDPKSNECYSEMAMAQCPPTLD